MNVSNGGGTRSTRSRKRDESVGSTRKKIHE